MQILAGKYRRQRLVVPPGRNTRPTLTRVRQVMFDILSHGGFLPRFGHKTEIDQKEQPWRGVRVLDVFAGSGSLGLEALSRGAEWAGFYEIDSDAQAVLQTNIAHLHVTAHTQLFNDVLCAAPVKPTVDVVFFDPPYDRIGLWQMAWQRLRQQGCLSPQALLVVQLPKAAPVLMPDFLCRRKSLGITRIDFYADVGA